MAAQSLILIRILFFFIFYFLGINQHNYPSKRDYENKIREGIYYIFCAIDNLLDYVYGFNKHNFYDIVCISITTKGCF